MKKGAVIFEVEAENLTELGGPMGTERTSVDWRQSFLLLASAKKFAEEQYQKVRSEGDEDIVWRKHGKGWSTQDLRYVMYHVRRIKVSK